MENDLKTKLSLLFITTLLFILCLTLRDPETPRTIPRPLRPRPTCPRRVSDQTITPLTGTKHLLMSAYADRRVRGYDVRILGIFRSDSVAPLYCAFCCSGFPSKTTPPGTIMQHTENFGFPYVTTDVLCRIPENCDATHVGLVPILADWDPPMLRIRNRKPEDRKLEFNFTVCVSNLFGGYNNVLQFAQSLEMYRLLGVDRVVIYNTSCGPDLERLLQGYRGDRFLEVVPWPIQRHLTPSSGWLFSQSGGEVHYYGQLSTLNECVYRSMERSRYVLLNDIDEIVTPYRHDDLPALMEELQPQRPETGVFLIENHIFPKNHFEPSGKFKRPQWTGVPGVNILEHVYRETPQTNIYHPYKMIVQPRLVEWTSVHEVLKEFGKGPYKVPWDLCRIIHVRVALQGSLRLDQLHEDKRLWHFQDKLIPNVDRVLKRAGLLGPS